MSSTTRWAEPAEPQPRARGRGAGAVGQTESEWSQLIAMLELAQRWQELIGEFTCEDAHDKGANADDPCSASRCSNDSEGNKAACAPRTWVRF